jgi:hypothetical protein
MESKESPLRAHPDDCEIIAFPRSDMDELRELRRIAEWKELFHENGVSHPDYKLRIEKDSTGYRLIVDRGRDNVIEFKRKAGEV